MISDRSPSVLILAGLFLSARAAAEEPLRHDVFARPTLTTLTAAAQEASASSPAVSPPATWNPRLTAVMVAGKGSLATIDGRILKVGESADGFQLIRVADSEAVVVREGQRYTLTMSAPGPIAIKSRGGE
jgi:hypothetical protein